MCAVWDGWYTCVCVCECECETIRRNGTERIGLIAMKIGWVMMGGY